MRPWASPLPPVLSVSPGGEVTTEIAVRNLSEVVDEFTFEVVGVAAPWTDVTPPSIHLFPGDEGRATVRFRPPRHHSTPAGSAPFTLRVIALEDLQNPLALESTLDVGGFVSLSASVAPTTSSGRDTGRHLVMVQNEGNLPANVGISASDAEHMIEFALHPSGLTVPPGGAGTIQLTGKGREPFRDTRPRPFRIVVSDERAPPVTLEAAMVPQPGGRGCLTRVPSVILMLIVLVVGLLGLALLVGGNGLGLILLAIAVGLFMQFRPRQR